MSKRHRVQRHPDHQIHAQVDCAAIGQAAVTSTWAIACGSDEARRGERRHGEVESQDKIPTLVRHAVGDTHPKPYDKTKNQNYAGPVLVPADLELEIVPRILDVVERLRMLGREKFLKLYESTTPRDIDLHKVVKK